MVAQHSWCFVSFLSVSSQARARPRRWGRMEGKDYVMEDGDVEQSRAFACSGRPAPFVVRAVMMCDNPRSSGPEGVEIVDYH